MFDDLRVECRSGYKAEETPVRFTLDGTPHEVVDVCDRWYDPDADYFKVKAEDGCLYFLRRDRRTGSWSLRYVRYREPEEPPSSPPDVSRSGPH